MDDLDRMKLHDGEEFTDLVAMHLSFLVEVPFHVEGSNVADRDPSVETTRCTGGIMDGQKLTEEGVCQIYQIIQYLQQPQQIVTEGIFRKHGNLQKQKVLKQILNTGTSINLDDGEFSVHECASVLKGFLQDLPEPLLTEAHFEAHRQVAEMSGDKRLQALQLLTLLLPDPNYNILKDLLLFLHKVTISRDRNKMDSLNLGTLFAVHLMCPRKMPREELGTAHGLFAEAIAYMIDHAPHIFDRSRPPPQLLKDVSAHNARVCTTPKRHLSTDERTAQSTCLTVTPFRARPVTSSMTSPSLNESSSSPVVNTIFSFVDHSKSREIATSQNTETALAELYAQVQSMPESAKKKRLVKQFNEANGCGTPVAASKPRSALFQDQGVKAKASFKNWIVPKAVKDKKSGSYDLKVELKATGSSTPTFNLLRKTSSSSEEDVVSTPKTLKPINLIVTPSTPKAESQNSLYCKNSAQIAYSSMADECDSMAETKELSPDELMKQIATNTPKPEFKSSEKENFV